MRTISQYGRRKNCPILLQNTNTGKSLKQIWFKEEYLEVHDQYAALSPLLLLCILLLLPCFGV